MFWTIVTLLFLMWLLGMISGQVIHGFLHLLLLACLVSVVIRLVQGRPV